MDDTGECNHTNLLALLVQVVDSLTSWLCSRTHQDDDVLSILSTIVVEEVVPRPVILVISWQYFSTTSGLHRSKGCKPHGVKNVSGFSAVPRVTGRSGVNARLRKSSMNSSLTNGRMSSYPSPRSCGTREVRKPLKKVNERNLCLQCSQVRGTAEVHNLLDRTWSRTYETCLTASHYVLVVTEDKVVRSQCTS